MRGWGFAYLICHKERCYFFIDGLGCLQKSMRKFHWNEDCYISVKDGVTFINVRTVIHFYSIFRFDRFLYTMNNSNFFKIKTKFACMVWRTTPVRERLIKVAYFVCWNSGLHRLLLSLKKLWSVESFFGEKWRIFSKILMPPDYYRKWATNVVGKYVLEILIPLEAGRRSAR